MNRYFARLFVAVLAANLLTGVVTQAADEKGGPLAHVVFFSLKDRSQAARTKLVDSCKTHLTNHDGVLSFSVGTIAEDVKEPVSDRDFDVAIHVVFKNKAASAAYQVHPRHKKFIEENKADWAKVRVFDSYLAAP